jgi:hypothetical protein
MFSGGMMNQSKSMPFSAIHSILIFLLASMSLVACSSSKEGGLITDAVALTDCPQKSCAQGVADPADTKILLQTPVSNVMLAGSTFAEVAGDCYVSLYPQNFFEVTLTFNGAGVINYFPTGFIPRCNQGKFYFPINLTGGQVGTYVLTAQLVVVDSQGLQTRPPFKTVNSTIIMR